MKPGTAEISVLRIIVMGQEIKRNNVSGSVTDDAYWESLFQIEESFAADFKEVAAPPDPPCLARELVEELPLTQAGIESPVLPAADPWQLAQAYFEADKSIQLKVVGYNKGGLLIAWNGVQGFVPASQLVDFPQFHLPRERQRAMAGWIDSDLNLKIIEVNKESNRLIFSERAALVPADARESLLNDVQAGEKRVGTVTNLTEFGAFVDLGGVEGLIHISEISWSRVVHPSIILVPGQDIDVLVLSVNPESGRIALSMKQLHPDPWLTAEERYRPGQLVRGKVGNITTYGAFVVLEEELEGLVHISELAEGMFLHPRDVVDSGELVVARVLKVDSKQKRIALSMRGLSDPAAA
jgi:small subunit ribosomal protein S1